MDKQNYNWFHKSPKIQKKLITKNNFTYRIILKVLEQIIGRRKNLRILDYGCGVGTIDFYLASLGHKVVGLDVSPHAITTCRKSAQAIGVHVDFSLITKKLSQKFDLIFCLEVIEHVPNDQQLITYLSTLLKKNGILVLSTPSKNAPLHKLGLATGFDRQVGHLRRYTPKDLTRLTSKFKTLQLLKKEGIIRNLLFTKTPLGSLIRFLKGPFSDLVTFLDDLTIPLFGESDLILITQRI